MTSAQQLLHTAHIMLTADQHELVCMRPDAFELLRQMLTTLQFSEAEVLNAALRAGISEEQCLRLKACLPVRT